MAEEIEYRQLEKKVENTREEIKEQYFSINPVESIWVIFR